MCLGVWRSSFTGFWAEASWILALVATRAFAKPSTRVGRREAGGEAAPTCRCTSFAHGTCRRRRARTRLGESRIREGRDGGISSACTWFRILLLPQGSYELPKIVCLPGRGTP